MNEENKKDRVERNLNNDGLLRFGSSRVSPLNELEYVQGLISSRQAVNHIKFDEKSDDQSEWNDAVLNIIKELKGSPSFYMNPISQYLKLAEKGLDLNSINLEDFEEPIKDFIKQREYIFNLRATLMRHKDLFLRWGLFANQVFVHSDIPPREKEIIILRIAWLSQSEYEWEHHVAGAKQAKLFSDEVIKRIKQGPEAEGWDFFDASLVRAVDELYAKNCMSDSTWKILSERYKTNQLIEILFIVGYYNLLALTMNSLGAQVEGMYKTNQE
ncbi:MAG: Carboxymuconolactone decarboxylase family protein [Candidatus Lokiarchaeum sp. GC14_75]|nr:MAG: Carboxymuconolactone decarboxylase family protein [Candidatus Lokiarchaeum sp. GC14_75]